jgi:hypothetical protein
LSRERTWICYDDLDSCFRHRLVIFILNSSLIRENAPRLSHLFELSNSSPCKIKRESGTFLMS